MRRIQQLSDDVMTIEEGSLYSALDSTREALELSSEPESGFSASLMVEMRGSGRSESNSETEHDRVLALYFVGIELDATDAEFILHKP